MTIPIERMQQKILANSIKIESGCWIWQKSKQWNGYGRYSVGGGVAIGAHRASFIAFVGEIPAGLDVCHKCDIRDCVNPDHLFAGTRSENILDAIRKGRMTNEVKSRGDNHYAAKLKDADIPIIISRLSNGETKASIARDYGVTHRVITLVQRGETRKHVLRSS